jgi:type I restriction enzyme S subunit
METLQPKLRFSEFTSEWHKRKLKEVTSYVDYRGRAPKKTESGHFLVTAKNIKKGYIDYNCSKEYVSESDYLNVMSKGLPEIGDVLFTNEAPMGQVAQVNDKSIALAQRVIKFRGNKGLSNDYLLHYMLSNVFQNIVSEKAIGTTVQGISGKELHNINISFPSFQEQTKIANFLSSVDEKLNLLKEKKELLEDYKKGIIQKIFNQEIRFKDDNDYDFEDWENKTLGECLSFEQPTKYLVASTDYNDDFETPVLTAGKTFILGYTDEVNGIFKKEELPVIIFDDFTTATQFVNFPFKAKSSAMKILKAKENINIKFVYEAMQNLKFEVGGHGRHWISIYSNLYIDLPSLSEQTKIANFLSAIDEKIELVSNQIQDTQEYKKGLLQQMFV